MKSVSRSSNDTVSSSVPNCLQSMTGVLIYFVSSETKFRMKAKMFDVFNYYKQGSARTPEEEKEE